MAKYWTTTHQHDYPWDGVAAAYWRRYPNPNSAHVFSEDFIESRLTEDGRLYTKRFISKTNSLPSWGRHFFSTKRVPLIEEAYIDPREKTLITYTRNIGRLRYFMGVTEKVVFRPSPVDDRLTLAHKEVWIESDVFGFQAAIKRFGVDRFKTNSARATAGFDWVLERLYGKVSPVAAAPTSLGKMSGKRTESGVQYSLAS